VVLAQGWKRQIRRMFDSVDVPVRRLVRVRVGSFRLTDLHAGEARPLAHGEVTQLASCARATTNTRRPLRTRAVARDLEAEEPVAPEIAPE
jgi:hypothetical protein